ncbi:partitioning defective 3 homolog [Salvelinus alpinus]
MRNHGRDNGEAENTRAQNMFRQAMRSPVILFHVVPASMKTQYEQLSQGSQTPIQLSDPQAQQPRDRGSLVVQGGMGLDHTPQRMSSRSEPHPIPNPNHNDHGPPPQLVPDHRYSTSLPNSSVLTVGNNVSSAPSPSLQKGVKSKFGNDWEFIPLPSLSETVYTFELDFVDSFEWDLKRCKEEPPNYYRCFSFFLLGICPEDLGFSITSRDVPIGGSTPIHVKNILARGADIQDGHLKAVDRLKEVNGVDLNGSTQEKVVALLRATPMEATVSLLVLRQENSHLPREVKTEEDDLVLTPDSTREFLTFNIPLSDSGRQVWRSASRATAPRRTALTWVSLSSPSSMEELPARRGAPWSLTRHLPILNDNVYTPQRECGAVRMNDY